MPERLEEWFISHPMFGVLLMALLGGFLSHLKSMAATLTAAELTWRERIVCIVKCFLSLCVRMIGAALGGLAVLFAWRALGWPWEYGFIAAGVVGMFSTEFFEWLFVSGKEWIAVKLGVRASSSDRGAQ